MVAPGDVVNQLVKVRDFSQLAPAIPSALDCVSASHKPVLYVSSSKVPTTGDHLLGPTQNGCQIRCQITRRFFRSIRFGQVPVRPLWDSVCFSLPSCPVLAPESKPPELSRAAPQKIRAEPGPGRLNNEPSNSSSHGNVVSEVGNLH